MMIRTRLRVIVLAMLMVVQGSFAATLNETVDGLAANLAANQVSVGLPEWNLFTWPNFEDFAGTLTQGMICAYDYLGDPNYLTAADNSAAYLNVAGAFSTPYGDTILAFALLGEQTTANTFFLNVSAETPGGAHGYVNAYRGLDTSSAVFYLSQLTMAAYLVDVPEKEVWRQGVIDTLGRVDDESAIFPVQAIGIATWALASTGPLDDTLIASDASHPVWGGMTLADLPSILQGHQVPQGELDAGGFYWRLDHSADGDGVANAGYFEDAVYCLLGLYSAAAHSTDQAAVLEESIVNGVKAVLSSLAVDGIVYEHLAGGQPSLVYDAELLCLVDNLGIDPNLDLVFLDEINGYAGLGLGDLIEEE